MLSRVAAVMAPRTHNRRRVTGSSGRRREGGESERQRPNMSRRVFTSAILLLLVTTMCCGIGGGNAVVDGVEEPLSFPKFQWEAITEGETVSSLRVPSLVVMKGDVFAVAEAQCTKNENGFTGIASELLEWTDQESKREMDTTKLKTQVLEECPAKNNGCVSQTGAEDASQSRKKVLVSRPTTVVEESDIYMFAGTYRFEVNDKAVGSTSAAAKWGLLVAVGNVSNDGSSAKKKIYWKDASVIPWPEFENEHESLTGLIGGGGSGVKMKDSTIVFPMEGTKDGNAVSLILYSSANASGNLSKGMSADGCGYPSVVEWEKDKLMMMTACGDGRRRVYESGDKGNTWTEALGTLSRVWSNKHEGSEKGVGSGFITATIDGVNDKRDVMLVTLPVYSKKNENENEKGELHLWLTDNTHIVDIGPVSEKDDDAAASALLYKSGKSETNGKEELIALYEKKKVGDEKPSPGMVSVRLTAQLQRVKDVLATWKKVDKRVSGLCPSESAVQAPSPDSACKNTKITAGLVGFLSGNLSENTWRDEYLGVNATVKGKKEGVPSGKAETAESSDGVKFRGAWAEWPVGEQGENQLYHFTNYNFTLVATVSIDGEPKSGSVPLMGVRAGSDGGTKLMELSYGSGKKWQVLCSDGTTKKLKSAWDTQRQYQVAIVLQNGTQGSVYVDGQRVCESVQSNLETTNSKEISHFYIGGDGSNTESQGGVSVTVRNVLLYNRPLTFTGGSADLEEDIASPSEAPVEQASQQSRKRRETQQVPAASTSHAVGEKTGDAGTVSGSGLLPLLLLLLGLWEFAAL
ncbi:trans-sialidase [Trypanosoma cruzi cruzi]|uniref:Putative trans-sialidase, Group V n=1 Tax=Trypanosoma cruzi TaxID=5693 RepID=A0A2V2V1J7_TRYCR|nr:trans-sialidase [Trypanosoma cruzi cruzi]PWU90477.1 putative trans-sialidase, Group V [Trypanosoma cruzi]